MIKKSNTKTPRMVCKNCGSIFQPETLREKQTGTCSKDACYVPFSDTEGIQYFKPDIYKYNFKCLKCSKQIITNDINERFCTSCRKKNKNIKSRHHLL